MRLLIHYAGDIHQPLHCTALVNEKYPSGDRGGNSFPITPIGDINELHAAWDSILYEYPGYPVLPFSDDDWESLGKNASRMFDQYPIDKDQANDLEPVNWATESLDISRSFVYKNVKENNTLSASYIKKGKTIAES